jgi:hypothetical protein
VKFLPVGADNVEPWIQMLESSESYRALFPLCETENGQGKEKSESGQLLDDPPNDSFATVWVRGESCPVKRE